MKTYARLAGDVVAEIIHVDADPPIEERYHPDVVATCVKLTASQAKVVQPGWLRSDSVFTAPPEPPAPPPLPRVITPRTFRLRFTAEEKGALTLAASKGLEAGDPTLQVFLDDLSASQEVDLDHPELRAGMDAIVAAKLISEARAAEILAA